MAKRLENKPEDWASVIGLPDAWDKRNIQALITTFENTHFNLPTSDEPGSPTIPITGKQWIVQEVKDARKQHELEGSDGSDFGLKSKQSDMRIICAIPRPLHAKLLEAYPTIFRDVKMHLWFARNFPQFKVPRKI